MSDGAQSKYYFAIMLFMPALDKSQFLQWLGASLCLGRSGTRFQQCLTSSYPGQAQRLLSASRDCFYRAKCSALAVFSVLGVTDKNSGVGVGYSRCQEVKGMVFASQFLPDPPGLMGSVTVLHGRSTLSRLLSYMA